MIVTSKIIVHYIKSHLYGIIIMNNYFWHSILFGNFLQKNGDATPDICLKQYNSFGLLADVRSLTSTVHFISYVFLGSVFCLVNANSLNNG